MLLAGVWAGDETPDVYASVKKVCPDGIDVVYLWVNGTSPEHLRQMAQYGRAKVGGLYKDYGTLRFGFRSVVEYAPFVERIFLVTNGEVPDYVDAEKAKTSRPQLIVVPHSSIMKKEILPTFNSNVIESHIHLIPGIRECILYMNDDMMLGKPLDPRFFVNRAGKLNVYYNGFTAPNIEGEKRSIWHRSVSNTNTIANRIYHKGEVVQHSYPAHHCYFFKRSILEKMNAVWSADYDVARKNRFRKANDVVISFLHAVVATEEGIGDYVSQRRNFYFSWWKASRPDNEKTMKTIATGKYQCICLNDQIGGEPNADAEVDFLFEEYSKILPRKAPFEK